MRDDEGTVLGNPVRVISGDLARVEADGVLVPHFRGAASFAGVGGAVARGGAMRGMRMHQAYLEQAFPPPAFGSVIAAPSGGGVAWWLLHATSVGGGAAHDADVARTVARNAMRVARERGVTSLSMPVLATGMAGDLSPREAAVAVLSGIADHVAGGGLPVPVRIIIHGDPKAHADVADVLRSADYPTGGRDEDGARLAAMAAWQRDLDAFAGTYAYVRPEPDDEYD